MLKWVGLGDGMNLSPLQKEIGCRFGKWCIRQVDATVVYKLVVTFFVKFYFVVVSVVTVIPFPVHMFHECVFVVGCCEDGWCGGYLCCMCVDC